MIFYFGFSIKVSFIENQSKEDKLVFRILTFLVKKNKERFLRVNCTWPVVIYLKLKTSRNEFLHLYNIHSFKIYE